MQTISSRTLVVGFGSSVLNDGGRSELGVLLQPWVGIIILLVSVYASGKYRYRWQVSDVQYTYGSAWVKGELWRAALASIVHLDIPHFLYSLLGVLWTGLANRGKVCVFHISC